jgi:hypothetical protein
VYVCWLAFESVFVYLFIVETKGRSLEETAALFDGEEAEHAIATHGGAAPHEIRDDLDEKLDDPGYSPTAELKA